MANLVFKFLFDVPIIIKFTKFAQKGDNSTVSFYLNVFSQIYNDC